MRQTRSLLEASGQENSNSKLDQHGTSAGGRHWKHKAMPVEPMNWHVFVYLNLEMTFRMRLIHNSEPPSQRC